MQKASRRPQPREEDPRSAAARAAALLDGLLAPRGGGPPGIAAAPLDLARARDELAAEGSAAAHGVLALLYAFGLPDAAGRLDFPGGFPRQLELALDHLRAGLSGSCAICYTLLGFLLSLGYPLAKEIAIGVLQELKGASAAGFAVMEAGLTFPSDGGPPEDTDAAAVSYLLGGHFGDTLGALAFGSASMHGLVSPGLRVRLLADGNNLSLWKRRFRAAADDGAVCTQITDRMLPGVLRSVQNCEQDQHRDWKQRPFNEAVPLEQSKHWADLLLKASASDASVRYRYAKLLFEGSHSVGRNITAAAEQYNQSAEGGYAGGHWNLFLMQMRGEVAESDEHIRTIIDGKDFGPHHKALARFYAHKQGLAGLTPDAVAAGRWLREAAEAGDSNAQMLLAKGLRGESEQLLRGVDVGPRNASEALRFFRLAAAQGRVAAGFMATYLSRGEPGGCLRAYGQRRRE